MPAIVQNLPPEFQFVILLITLIGAFGLGITAIAVWGRVRQLQIEADIKTDMLERGLSVEEIRAVLTTSMRGKRRHEVEAELTSKLAEVGLDGDQIKQVLEAGQPYWMVTPPKHWKTC